METNRATITMGWLFGEGGGGTGAGRETMMVEGADVVVVEQMKLDGGGGPYDGEGGANE